MINEFKYLIRRLRLILIKTCAQSLSTSLQLDSLRTVIIAPHPDDEMFGCGGLINYAIENGCEVNVLYLSTGAGSHRSCCNVAEHKVGIARRQLAIKSAEITGIKPERLIFLDGTDGDLPGSKSGAFADFADILHSKIRVLEPDAVFCPHPFEGWSDHIAADELIRAAIDKIPEPPRLYHYCVWFWYSMPLRRAWRINWRQARVLDIKDYLPLKKQAVRIYLDALAPCGNPWVGKLPEQFLRAFDWDKELFFEADIRSSKGKV